MTVYLNNSNFITKPQCHLNRVFVALNISVPVRQRLRTLIRDTHTLTQLTDKEGAQRGFLVVILNIYIDDVHRLKSLLLS